METLSDILRLRRRVLGDKAFLKTEDATLSYAALDDAASQLAHVLETHNVRKGDPVGLFLPSCFEFAIGYYACQKIGAIATSVSALYKLREVRGIVERTDMKTILTNRETQRFHVFHPSLPTI